MLRKSSEFKILQMYVYPVKGLPGVRVFRNVLDDFGLRFDRNCILVNEEGIMLTRRNTDGMADFEIELREFSIGIYSKRLHAEVEIWMESSGKNEDIRVWDRVEIGSSLGNIVDDFMSNHFNMRVSGYQMVKGSGKAGFHDSAPILVCNAASIRSVEAIENQEIEMFRFRPNIVIDTMEAFDEVYWDDIMIGGVRCIRSKMCTRCIIINQNPESGVVDKNVLKMLLPFSPLTNKVQFGVYYQPDGVVMVESGDHIVINYK